MFPGSARASAGPHASWHAWLMARMLALALALVMVLSTPVLASGIALADSSAGTLHVCAFEQAEQLLRPMINATLYMALLRTPSTGHNHMRSTLSLSPPSTPAGSHNSSCLPTLLSMRYALRASLDGPLLLPHACGFEWHSPAQACALLSQPPTTLLFVGDSITRHFMHAAQLLIRGDLALGALRQDLPPDVSQSCTCNRQFAIKSCRQWILKDTRSLTQAALPCPAARVAYLSEWRARGAGQCPHQGLNVGSSGSRPGHTISSKRLFDSQS